MLKVELYSYLTSKTDLHCEIKKNAEMLTYNFVC